MRFRLFALYAVLSFFLAGTATIASAQPSLCVPKTKLERNGGEGHGGSRVS